jgi:hypothetical protein
MYDASRCRNCAATFTLFSPGESFRTSLQPKLSRSILTDSRAHPVLRIRVHILLDL